MFVPCMPSRPADIYTIRVTEHEAQTSLTMSLRRLVAAAGGTFMINLIEGSGFMMPTTAPCPLTSYLHGGLLEEGRIHVSRLRLEKEETREMPLEEDSSDTESVEEDENHPGLRMQWNWTELKDEERK
ncbi:hypothetical protein OPT61_g9268 [Boeremia exigua]|uniref:Uncharacterized protein n=1 Tax=Boeremia exigua TaxID=749465 RepID=A0ACC2HUT6_9PLEO|nr:hypothetical protein OPT61_g9268 [Boeremia exigua]